MDVCIFSKHLQWLQWDRMAATVAEIGFDGIDLAVRAGGHVEPERVEKDLPRAVDAATDAGLSVPMMVTDINDPDNPLTERVLKTAAECGVRFYRMAYLNYDYELGVAQCLERHRATVEGLAELNERYGLHGAYQNHAGTRVGAALWDLWPLLRDLDARWVGCQYDIRHAVIEGSECWEVALHLLKGWVKCLAVKDGKWTEPEPGVFVATCEPMGTGMVDFERFFGIISEVNFDGPVSLHYEYPLFEGDPEAMDVETRIEKTVAGMRGDLARLREMMGKYL